MQICLQVRETDIAYFLGIFPSYPSIYQCIPFYFIFHFKIILPNPERGTTLRKGSTGILPSARSLSGVQ